MIVLETPRLLVRRFTLADADAVAEILGDPEVMRFSVSGPMNSEQVRIKTIGDYLASYDNDLGIGRWAIERRLDGRLIGFCGLMPQEVDGHKEIEIGYRLARDAWGQGLATEAVLAVRDYAFTRLGLARLIAIIDPENVASQRVAIKAGLRYEKNFIFHQRNVRVYAVESG